MALKTYRPITPSLRELVTVSRDGLHKGKPVKALTVGQHSSGGRNNGGSGIAYPDTVAAAAQGLAALNVTSVINGHTPSQSTLAEMRQYAEFNREFATAARAAKQAGKTPAQFAAEWKVPAQFPGYSAGLGDSVRNNAQVIFDELK